MISINWREFVRYTCLSAHLQLVGVKQFVNVYVFLFSFSLKGSNDSHLRDTQTILPPLLIMNKRQNREVIWWFNECLIVKHTKKKNLYTYQGKRDGWSIWPSCVKSPLSLFPFTLQTRRIITHIQACMFSNAHVDLNNDARVCIVIIPLLSSPELKSNFMCVTKIKSSR